LQTNITNGVCLGAKDSVIDAECWHAHYGHIGYDALRQLSHRNMVSGLSKIEDRRMCDTCIITKQWCASFSTKAKFRANAILDLVHADLCGPITPTSPGGQCFFLLLVDDATRFMWIKLLTAKSDAAASIKVIKAAAKVEVGRPPHVLRTDNGGEFTGKELADFCTTEGIQRHFSTPYTPKQNGVMEHRNQTVLTIARAMLKEREMLPRYWGRR
jgi:transposase InsO family protein